MPLPSYGVSPMHRGVWRGAHRRPCRPRCGNACFCIPRLAGWHAVANPSEHDSRPSGGPGGRDGGIPVVRALIVLVVFVAVTVLVLSEHPSRRRPKRASGPTAGPTTTTTTKPTHPTTTTTTIAPSKVPVLVANASGVTGAAAAISAQLKPARLGHAAAGQRLGPGDDVARVLRGRLQTRRPIPSPPRCICRPPSVAPYTTAAPISSIGTAEVVVVVGPDLADKATDHLVHHQLIGEPGRRAGPRWCSTVPSPEVRRALAPLLVEPVAVGHRVATSTARCRPIVADPAEARPLDGVAELLARLAHRFGVVAVVSGRPVSFLVERLAPAGQDHPTAVPARAAIPPASSSSASTASSGRTGPAPSSASRSAERWRPAVDEAVARLRSAAPPGVVVEGKGLAVTVHWRQAPEAEPWVDRRPSAAEVGADRAPGPSRAGCRSSCARRSTSTRAPSSDAWSQGCSAACYLGDDLGDLPAFAALADLAPATGWPRCRWRWSTTRAPPRWPTAADLVLSGPQRGAGPAWAGWPTSR